MKEIIKIISKKLFIYSIIFNTLYSIADYGEAFALSYFGKSPLTLDKLIKLAICIAITHIIMLIAGKVASYIDNVNNQKTQTKIQKYYFNKLQSMTMEQISNTHTGYIHKLITNLSFYFFEMIWQFEISVIPLIIGGTSILIMVCKQSIVTGIICILISALAVYLKYIIIKNKQKYQKKVNEAESKYNATFIDFIQNIIAVRKLNISKFCNDKITENSEEYLKVTKLNERKRSNANGAFTCLMDCLYLVVIASTIIMVSKGEDGLPYLLFYLSAIGKLYSNLNSLVRLIDITERFKTSKKQLDEYFKDSKEVKLSKNFKSIKLKNVVFSYTKDSAKIKIPEFILNKGDKISIIGESGQGKTTTMNILSGLYPLEKGELLVDNQLKKDCRMDLVFVSQEVELFDLSIRDNLCLGKEVSEEKITNMIEKYLKDKTYVIVTHRPKLKELCNKHYVFDNHMMKELITV